VVFVFYELIAQGLVVNLRVFKERTYSIGVFLMTLLGFALYGSLVLLPIFLQTLLGYPALQAGLAMAPRGLGSFLAMPVVGFLTSKVDPRKLIGTGLISAAFTLIWLSRLNLNAGFWDIFWPQAIQGMSLGLLFVPLTTVSMDAIQRENMGNATSLFNLMRNIGGGFGIAAVTTLLARSQQRVIHLLGAHINSYDLGSQRMLENLRKGIASQGVDSFSAGRRAYAVLFGIIQRQAAMISFNTVFLFLGAAFLVVVPFVPFMERPKRGAGPRAVH